MQLFLFGKQTIHMIVAAFPSLYRQGNVKEWDDFGYLSSQASFPTCHLSLTLGTVWHPDILDLGGLTQAVVVGQAEPLEACARPGALEISG